MHKRKLRNGLMLALSPLLFGCETTQSANVIPDYTPEFLECVADEYEASVHGDCTKRAVDDWSIMIE